MTREKQGESISQVNATAYPTTQFRPNDAGVLEATTFDASAPAEAKPFLKWAGGKQQLLAQFESLFPSANSDRAFGRYFEPFVGGGAVFFYLWSRNRLPRYVFLFDNNEELINTYLVIRENVEELVRLLATHQRRHSREYYYKIRKQDRQDVALSDIERAARTIYLNRTCYNGLYRVNRKGQFNVPIGSYENPKVLYEETLRSASLALQSVSIAATDFETVLDYAQAGDFFYFDPPYDPVSKTASFTGYTAGDFGDEDQRRLARVFRRLSERGCLCMLSNSYTPFILELYRDFRIETVQAIRAINSDANRRGNIKEVVVLNY
jgi:DNA adenine methylase